MRNTFQIQLSADPTAEEAAATVAAIATILGLSAAPSTPRPAAPPNRWRDAARLTAQGLTPTRTPARPGWGTIERIRRAGRGGSGITGM